MWKILSLLVTSLIVGLAAPAGATPEQAQDDDGRASIKVRFQKSAGLPDWNTSDILIDSRNLTREQLKRLHNFLEAARFFELKSTLTPLPEGIPDWPAVYTLTVEMNGRKHVIQWDAFIERKEIQPLVDWVQLHDLLRQLRENPPRILPPTFPEEIRPIDPGILLPVPLPQPVASKIKVKYAVSGGLLPRVWVDVAIDSADLTADELRQLKQLIEEAKFFELPAELPQGGGCIPSFSLTIEMDGRRHTVHGIPMAEPESLKRLTEWLEKRSLATAVKIRFVRSGGFTDKVWVAEIDATKLSAEDARKLRQLIEDARFFEQPGRFPSELPVDGTDVTITVEMDGRKHMVTSGEGRLPAELHPLAQWLSDRAVDPTAGLKRLAQDSLPASAAAKKAGDDPIKKTILVEVRGRLMELVFAKPEFPRYRPWHAPKYTWYIEAGNQVFSVDFGRNEELLAMARRLHGQEVLLEGVLETEKELVYVGPVPLDPVAKLQPADRGFIELEIQVIRVRSLNTARAIDLNMIIDETLPRRIIREGVFMYLIGDLDMPEALILEATPSGVKALVRVNGQLFWLDLGDNSELILRAAQLSGKKVVINGWLQYRPTVFSRVKDLTSPGVPVIVVSNLQPAEDAAAKPVVRVEITGKLDQYLLDIDPPASVWHIIAKGQGYKLNFTSRSQIHEAMKLIDQTVTIRGTLKDGVVTVSDIHLPPVG